MTQISHMDGSI